MSGLILSEHCRCSVKEAFIPCAAESLELHICRADSKHLGRAKIRCRIGLTEIVLLTRSYPIRRLFQSQFKAVGYHKSSPSVVCLGPITSLSCIAVPVFYWLYSLL